MHTYNLLSLSVEMAEDVCASEPNSHLLSINSHEEQQLVQLYFHKMSYIYNINTTYLFIGLKKVYLLVLSVMQHAHNI